MLRSGFSLWRSAGAVRLSGRAARSHVVHSIWVSMAAPGFVAVDLVLHELGPPVDRAAHRRCSTRARLVGDRRVNSCRTSIWLERAIGVFLELLRDGASRLQRRCSVFLAVPTLSARARACRAVASVGSLRRGWRVRRSRGRPPVWSLHAVARQRWWRAVVGRSAAISVRCGDRGLWLVKWSPPGFAAENRRRSVALDLVFGAPGRIRRCRGATRFREPVGLWGGGSVGQVRSGPVRPGWGFPKKRRCQVGACGS